MAVSVRVLTLDDDVDAFGRIVTASYTALPGHPVDPEYDAELVDVASRVATATVVGAFDGGVPVGCVTYVNDPSSPHAERLGDDEASFRMLAVDVAAQGRGVGAALVRACLERATTAGRAAVFIHSGDWMSAAHRLYSRLGFVAVPSRNWVIPDLGITLLGFRRPLTP